PESCLKIIGHSHSERARTMIDDVISSSEVIDDEFCLRISDKVYSAMKTLRKFLYENVYRSPQVHKEFVKAKKILSDLYFFFLNNEDDLQRELENMEMGDCMSSSQSGERIVCDLIASITDRYALDLYKKIFFPSPLV
ncbi:MAG: deoxyguanosinetriphosphate triphosphohydrolase, partial [Desulfobacterales bacterium]|nr:deoxyguanosinetriphosphate triphosphohydrolase [Desulfobacterales bacterium]